MCLDQQTAGHEDHDYPIPKLTVRPRVWLDRFWSYEAVQHWQTTKETEQVFAGEPACTLVASGREDSYGSEGRD
jgi:hypothetical protein